MMKVYLVTAEGTFNDYGSSTHCLGIFSSIEKAQQVANDYKEAVVKGLGDDYDEEYDGHVFGICELIIDEVHGMRQLLPAGRYAADGAVYFVNDLPILGNYLE